MCWVPSDSEVTREVLQRAEAMGAVAGSHPSSGVELPSSHCSPDSTFPSPQAGGWQTPFRHLPAQGAAVVRVTRSGPQVVGVSLAPQNV